MGNKETLLRFISEQGYKRNSPDKNRPFNIIPSNNITMKGVDFPVLGMSNTGHIQKMYPGMDYEFDGDVVFEIPMKQQFGGDMKFWRPVLQTGGEKKPLYVKDINDPRYRAYQDSLALYKGTKSVNDFIKKNNIGTFKKNNDKSLSEDEKKHMKIKKTTYNKNNVPLDILKKRGTNSINPNIKPISYDKYVATIPKEFGFFGAPSDELIYETTILANYQKPQQEVIIKNTTPPLPPPLPPPIVKRPILENINITPQGLAQTNTELTPNLNITPQARIPKYFEVTDKVNQPFGGTETNYKVYPDQDFPSISTHTYPDGTLMNTRQVVPVYQGGGENPFTVSGNPVVIPSQGSYPLEYRDRGDKDVDGIPFSAARKVSRTDPQGNLLTRNQVAENQLMWNMQKQAYSPEQQTFNIWKNNPENTAQGFYNMSDWEKYLKSITPKGKDVPLEGLEIDKANKRGKTTGSCSTGQSNRGECLGDNKQFGGTMFKFPSMVDYEQPSDELINDDYNMERALELGYTPDETGHWPSVDYKTGEWLKSKKHHTRGMELMAYELNPELHNAYNLIENEKGKMQYIPKAQVGKNIRVKNADGTISVMNTDSPEYREMYESGQIQNAANTDDNTFWGGVLDEVGIKGTLSEFAKERQKQKKLNSWEQFANERFLGNFEKNMGQTLENLPESRKQEYEDYIDKLAFDEYVRTHPQAKGESRGQYIDRLQKLNENVQSFDRAYDANAAYNDATDVNKWRKFLVGLGSVVIPKPAMNYLKQHSDYYSTEEKQDMRDNPISTHVEDVVGTLEPLTIPVEGLYGNKSFSDIASGQSANIPMSARILGDPLMPLFEAAPVLNAGFKTAGRLLGTEEGLLSKAWKLNRNAEKLNDATKSYRVVGLDAFEDFKNTGILRSVTPNVPEGASLSERMMGSRPTGFPSFQKGYADMRYAPEEGAVIFETGLPTFKRGEINPVTGNPIKGRHYAHRVINPETGATMTEIPAADVRVFGDKPHWWKGYQQLDVPKPATNSDNVAKSILDNPTELEIIRNNINLSNDDIIKLEKYLDEVYDYTNLTPFQKKKILDRETYHLNKNNVSVDQRIQNNKNLLTQWENYKKDRIEYFNSPKFRERVNKQYDDMPDKIFKDFKEGLLQNLEKRPYIRPDVVSENAAAHYKPEPTHKLGIDDHKYGHTYYKDEYASDPRVIFHEGRHQLTNAEDEVYFFPSRKEIEEGLIHPDLLKFDSDLTDPKTGADYFLSPEEFIVRLDELKRDMSKVGYDYKTMDLTPEIIKQYRGLSPKEAIVKVTGKPYGVRLSELTPEQHEAVIQLLDQAPEKTKDTQRLLRWFKDDFLLDMINNKWGFTPIMGATGAGTLTYKTLQGQEEPVTGMQKGGVINNIAKKKAKHQNIYGWMTS